ncbi:MAG: hypothetical protein NUV67_02880 [archaeon]|nr:hypothetical protein [archaeon]
MELFLNAGKDSITNSGYMADTVSISKARLEELKRKATAFDKLLKNNSKHVMGLSENSLAKDWLSKEDEEAWKNL